MYLCEKPTQFDERYCFAIQKPPHLNSISNYSLKTNININYGNSRNEINSIYQNKTSPFFKNHLVFIIAEFERYTNRCVDVVDVAQLVYILRNDFHRVYSSAFISVIEVKSLLWSCSKAYFTYYIQIQIVAHALDKAFYFILAAVSLGIGLR